MSLRPTALPRSARWLLQAMPPLAVASVAALLARGRLRGLADPSWDEVAGAALVVGGLAVAGVRRALRVASGLAPRMRDELELGGPLVAAAYLVVGIAGPGVHPLVYGLMAGLVGFLHAGAAVLLLALALAFDALVTLRTGGWVEFTTHALFLGLFAGIYRAVLNARLALARRAEQEAVKNRIREVEERARTYRLATAGSSDAAPDGGGQWLLAAVKEVEGAVGAVLEVGELALRTHTCAAFLLQPDDRTLVLHDCRSASEEVRRGPMPAGEGILAGVLKRSVPVRMASAGGLRGVTWYEGGRSPKSICVVPLAETSGQLRGVVVADRLDPEPFDDRDEALLRTLAGEVLRAIEVERVLVDIRRAHDEKGRFYRAIEELNRAANLEAVFDAVLEGARQLAGLDFAAVTLVSEVEGKRQHRVARIRGVSPAGKTLEGRTFEDNQGLVANVVRYGTPLPGRELKAMDKQVVFDDATRLRGLGALKILPLAAGDRILGTLVAGSRLRASLDEDALRMLEVIALQAGQAVLRAQLFEQTELMATTDGLTGLLNHRAFQSRADGALAQARRYGRSCAVLLADIDHFKSVNDTYGHPVGDQVLKGVAQILREKARDTDVVARYGGEEFAIIMPETDGKGARVIAERIREAVQAKVFQTELGPLQVTLSLGIAAAPKDGTEKQLLVDLADQCLYFAKRHGRNRSVMRSEMEAGRARSA
jgi:two-component system cell cycle response regulator